MEKESETTTSTPQKRTGVVVVHGMGHPDPSALLDAIVLSIVEFMKSLADAQGEIEQPVKHPDTDEAGRPRRTVSFCGREWIFFEAHWAPHIASPPFLDTMRWAVLHFLAHAGVLLRDAVLRSLVPTIVALATIIVHTLWALLLLPARLFMLAAGPLLVNRAADNLERLYQIAMGATLSDADNPDTNTLMDRLRTWHRLAPRGTTYRLTIFILVPIWALAMLINVVAPSDWLALAALYLMVTSWILFHQFVKRLATDPVVAGAPVSIIVMQVQLTKRGFLQGTFRRPSRSLVFWDTVRLIFAGPAVAALSGATHWLTANREYQLLNYLDWAQSGYRPIPLIKAGGLITALAIFRILASVLWATLYLIGALLIIPLTALIVALSALGDLGFIGKMLSPVKRALEGLVLTSIGDINMFTRHPEQAAVARAQVEHALDAANARCDEVCIVAHSLGCAVSYDTLVQPHNKERTARVRTLMTIGGILPMVWRTVPRRDTFDTALPEQIRWVNLWARYDPAEGGPLSQERARIAIPGLREWKPPPGRGLLNLLPRAAPQSATFEDIAISNEDCIILDHTAYWQNYHEVIPRIAFEIWPDGAETLDGRDRSDAIRAFRRRARILARTGPCVLLWCAAPFIFLVSSSLLQAILIIAALAMLVLGNRRRGERVEPWPATTTDLPPFRNDQGRLRSGVLFTAMAAATSDKVFRSIWDAGA